MNQSHNRKKRTKYNLTTNAQRSELISALQTSGLSLKQVLTVSNNFQVAANMGLKYSTAKTIWKLYEEQGRINKKRKCKKALMLHKGLGTGFSMQCQQNSIVPLVQPKRKETMAYPSPIGRVESTQNLFLDKRSDQGARCFHFFNPSSFWGECLTKHFLN
eukprot:TRINITY_DN14817_c0_g1_i1.p1 TRINITY_DN14817_c0_g1~~TRINITY_DN14817_c0_g1_i1.p1  ORF type:complete len:160 (+),score=4.70 TRINITY_DN14817_c0_g1_i1:137-616(+)